MILLIYSLVDGRDVFSQLEFDVGEARQKFNITMKANVELKRQQASKVPLHWKEKMENLLTQLKDADIIDERDIDDKVRSPFVNPNNLMPQQEYKKLVYNARYLNSATDLANYSKPLETVQAIMTRVSGKFLSSMFYPHDESVRHTIFSRVLQAGSHQQK